MNKEIEVKILDINVENIQTLLERLNCKFQFDRLQRLVTYDFHPINSIFSQLNFEIEHITDKTNLSILQLKLWKFFKDLFDIVSENEKYIIKKEMESNLAFSDLFQKKIDFTKFDFFSSDKFINIVKKYSINPNKWIRIRTDGVTTTIATKHIKRDTSTFINEYDIDAVDETEMQISDFNIGIELMKQLGYFFRNYQEKRRIMYMSENGLEIDIDFWPMIPPYLEIEGKTEEDIYNMVNILGFKKNDVKIANTDDIYKIYGLNIYDFSELKFEKIEPRYTV